MWISTVCRQVFKNNIDCQITRAQSHCHNLTSNLSHVHLHKNPGNLTPTKLEKCQRRSHARCACSTGSVLLVALWSKLPTDTVRRSTAQLFTWFAVLASKQISKIQKARGVQTYGLWNAGWAMGNSCRIAGKVLRWLQWFQVCDLWHGQWRRMCLGGYKCAAHRLLPLFGVRLGIWDVTGTTCAQARGPYRFVSWFAHQHHSKFLWIQTSNRIANMQKAYLETCVSFHGQDFCAFSNREVDGINGEMSKTTVFASTGSHDPGPVGHCSTRPTLWWSPQPRRWWAAPDGDMWHLKILMITTGPKLFITRRDVSLSRSRWFSKESKHMSAGLVPALGVMFARLGGFQTRAHQCFGWKKICI